MTLRRYCGQDRTVLSYLIADIRDCRIGGNLSHWLIANSPGQSLFPGKLVPSVTITAMQPETGRQVAVALYVVAMVFRSAGEVVGMAILLRRDLRF